MSSDDYVDQYQALETREALLPCKICQKEVKQNLVAFKRHLQDRHNLSVSRYGKRFRMKRHNIPVRIDRTMSEATEGENSTQTLTTATPVNILFKPKLLPEMSTVDGVKSVARPCIPRLSAKSLVTNLLNSEDTDTIKKACSPEVLTPPMNKPGPRCKKRKNTAEKNNGEACSLSMSENTHETNLPYSDKSNTFGSASSPESISFPTDTSEPENKKQKDTSDDTFKDEGGEPPIIKSERKWFHGTEYECKICGSLYLDVHNFADHIRLQHNLLIKTYGKQFGKLATKESVYHCQVCQKEMKHVKGIIAR